MFVVCKYVTRWSTKKAQLGAVFLNSLERPMTIDHVDTGQHNGEHTNQGHSDQEIPIHDTDKATKTRILRSALQFVPQHGWSKTALSMGAEAEGLPSIAHGMFSKGGVELVYFFNSDCNERLRHQMELEYQQVDAGEKIKKKTTMFVKDSVVTRLKMMSPHINTWPQALGLMALPQNVLQSLTLFSGLIDDIWFYAGDKSTDLNWYTKRTTLAAVYKSTELFMLQDSSDNFQDTWLFLDRRLKNLASFGQSKGQVDSMCNGCENFFIGAFTTTRNILGMNDRNR